MAAKFKIIREEYWGAKSSIGEPRFYIMKEKKFFFWKWWSYVTHKIHINNGIHFEAIRFKSLPNAEKYIYEVLKNNKPIDSILRLELKTIEL